LEEGLGVRAKENKIQPDYLINFSKSKKERGWG
jgi:hypothetical protein